MAGAEPAGRLAVRQLLTLLAPNLTAKLIARSVLEGRDGRRATSVEINRKLAMRRVAMGPTNNITANARSAAQSWTARSVIAASVMVVTTGFALAQANQSAPAMAPATAEPAAQQAQPQTQPPASPGLTLPPQPPPPGATPPSASTTQPHGFFDNLGRWWHDSVADFNAKLKEQQSKLDDFNKKSAEAMANAASALQTSKVIEIHEPCAIAGNGAADCATAAVNACKGKGFKDGQPLDVRTAKKCNASLWVSGQPSTPADCPVETVVLRAACQ
jgi:hypothetical protein